MQDPYFTTDRGQLYHGDCTQVIQGLLSARRTDFDLAFLDPPFNLAKDYGPETDDALDPSDYAWVLEGWLRICLSALRPGGSLFLYNLPKWTAHAAAFLCDKRRLAVFQELIAVRVTPGYPRKKGLYPAHYGLLWVSKGEMTSSPPVIRTPIETCRHCGKEIKDYGGHREKIKQEGVRLADVWTDIPVVRHRKYKARGWKGPQLSTKLVQRVISLSTGKWGRVLDPFAGSGTTPAVCEAMGRSWVGVEVAEGACAVIKRRLTENPSAFHKYEDFVEEREDE